MNKIRTIFKRDWSGNKGVIDEYIEDGYGVPLHCRLTFLLATEKLDGMNIRLTLRNGYLVRLEKRRNPTKLQKNSGIVHPWYVDANISDPADKYIYESAENTDFQGITDGEYSAEAVGPKIQGNPLKLKEHRVFFFDERLLDCVPVFFNVPTTFDELKEWLPKQKSKAGNDCGIEGIVWHMESEHPKFRANEIFKIKLKDFKQ